MLVDKTILKNFAKLTENGKLACDWNLMKLYEHNKIGNPRKKIVLSPTKKKTIFETWGKSRARNFRRFFNAYFYSSSIHKKTWICVYAYSRSSFSIHNGSFCTPVNSVDIGFNVSSMFSIWGLTFHFYTTVIWFSRVQCKFNRLVIFTVVATENTKHSFSTFWIFCKNQDLKKLFISSSTYFCKWYGICLAFCFIGKWSSYIFALISVSFNVVFFSSSISKLNFCLVLSTLAGLVRRVFNISYDPIEFS